ncbi:MAG TPA: antibiotic biosynthesis monooxygenase [Nitrososphaera sp.]|nr:antibiotic biosynthesis monooxygenase [Nitrososphaera sp.]
MHPHHDARAPSSNSDGPVTVIVTRRAKKGKIKEFEEWMDGIIHEVMKFEGHMGSNIIRPTDELTNPEYVIIFRFSTYENLAKWERSEIRKEWLEKSRKVTEGEAVIEKQTGLEFWFTPRSGRPDKAHELPLVTPPIQDGDCCNRNNFRTGIYHAAAGTTGNPQSPWCVEHAHRGRDNGLAHDLCDNAGSN